jgi:hypothetical protein
MYLKFSRQKTVNLPSANGLQLERLPGEHSMQEELQPIQIAGQHSVYLNGDQEIELKCQLELTNRY